MANAVGLIETVGKVAAIEAMDTAAKSADIKIVGLENSRGGGRLTAKFEGEVSAVQTAVETAIQRVRFIGGIVYAAKVIARPSEELEVMLEATKGRVYDNGWIRERDEIEKKNETSCSKEIKADTNLEVTAAKEFNLKKDVEKKPAKKVKKNDSK